MSLLRYEAPDGTVRPWRLKEIVQGKPLGHPSHAMFVHFPVAFYVATLALDVLSRVGDFPAAPIAGSWLLIGAFAGFVLAFFTGLVDWWGMVRGSRKRRWATRHMLFQIAATATFVANFIIRWTDRGQSEAEIGWIVLDAIGVVVLLVGQWMGGVLVYEMAMRVSTATSRRGREAAKELVP